ncbi:AAA domain-containing protein [Yimella radicis]
MRDGGPEQAILRYWRMVELFSPQSVPKKNGRSRTNPVVTWTPGSDLPWHTLPPPDKPHLVWQHRVYLGVYALSDVYETLLRVFADDPDAYDPRPNGMSACALIVLDNDGRLMVDGSALSSCAWALGRASTALNDKSQAWAEGFAEAGEKFLNDACEYDELRQRSANAPDPMPVDAAALQELLALAERSCELSKVQSLPHAQIRIASRQMKPETAAELGDIDFLNSFFLDDLQRVAGAVGRNDIGDALKNFLRQDGQLDVSRRVDVVHGVEVLVQQTAVNSLPAGRWPSKPDEPLALAQQFAVNRAVHDLGPSSGLMGVNGPPGTGKTTLLRDLIASNIVDRANALASLARVSDAFSAEALTWRSDGKERTIAPLHPALTGFEMVVSSANNAAVENITNEIPAASAYRLGESPEIDYFADLATAVLRASTRDSSNDDDEMPGQDPPTQAWALLAARLGSKKNRGDFAQPFWWKDNGPAKSMDTYLKNMTQERLRVTWAEARREYWASAQRVQECVSERRAAAERMTTVSELSAALDEIRRRRARTRNRSSEASRELAGAERVLSRAQQEAAHCEHHLRTHLLSCPGTLETLFSFGRAMKPWRAAHTVLQAAVDDAAAQLRRCDDTVADLRQARQRLDAQDSADASLEHSTSIELDAVSAGCAADKDKYGAVYPDDDWIGDRQQTHAAWQDPELNQARSELMMAALRLHKDFIEHSANRLTEYLHAAVDVVQGRAPSKLGATETLAAWQLFFLVVPVVSTTFASFARMFGTLGPDSLGWLLIDEAGQCPPQQAVGAIWRSRRVVAVGDPMQLQPVVPTPPKVLRNIALTYGISETWIPPMASVQTLADRVAVFGTYLPSDTGPQWVSAPLRVHRRCDEPMFGISNEISYDGIMIHAKASKDDACRNQHDLFVPCSKNTTDDKHEPVAPSYWADEPATSDGHLQRNQVERAKKAIDYLHKKGVPYSEIMAISPFRAVAEALEPLEKAYPGIRAGTIHRAQGREADVVLLVLGGDQKRIGALRWAASPPNLVNVAVSRAKRRLFVISDYASWSGLPNFETIAAELPRRA